MNTQDILKNLIQRLYQTSLQNGLNFRLNAYDTSGNNRLQTSDGTFLGNFSNKYDVNSMFNEYGTYGSKYSMNSIFNQYGQYGSKYAAQSPFNKYTSDPPQIYIGGQYFGRLTANKYLDNAKATDVFLFYVMQQLDMLDDRLDDLLELISRMD